MLYSKPAPRVGFLAGHGPTGVGAGLPSPRPTATGPFAHSGSAGADVGFPACNPPPRTRR